MLKLNENVLIVRIPENASTEEALSTIKSNLQRMIGNGSFDAKDIIVTGKVPAAVALLLGRQLPRVCKSVSLNTGDSIIKVIEGRCW